MPISQMGAPKRPQMKINFTNALLGAIFTLDSFGKHLKALTRYLEITDEYDRNV